MEIRNLGRSGLRVSALGLGCNNIGNRTDFETSRRVVHKALDLGITLFDSADIYGVRGYGGRGGGEVELGQILGDQRKNIVLATKFGMKMSDDGTKQGASRRYIMSAVEDSLRRLNTDWIDLYQLHVYDPRTPLEETMRALDDIVRQGKVRYVGCSTLKGWQVVDAQRTAQSLGLNSFISCQDEYSLLKREIEGELAPAIRAHGLGLISFQPLAGGMLTGKYRRNVPLPADGRLTRAIGNKDGRATTTLTDRNYEITEKLVAFVEARGRTMPELAFSWLLHRSPVSCVIAGATKPEQLEENVKAGGWKLSAEELKEIDAITL